MSAFPTGVAPLLLVCIDRASRTLPAVRASGRFVVNFLRADRDVLCAVLASKTEDKFAGVAWRVAANDMPVLHEDSLAYAECATQWELQAGDHVVLIGLVVGGEPPIADVVPLV